MKYLLDSCALISYILGEEEAVTIKDLLKNTKHQFFLNYINYGEILFILGKKGLKNEVLEEVKNSLKHYLSITFLKTDNFEIIELASELKTKGGLAYFDALILATSKKYKLTIITKDQEFKKFSKDFQILFL